MDRARLPDSRDRQDRLRDLRQEDRDPVTTVDGEFRYEASEFVRDRYNVDHYDPESGDDETLSYED